MNSVHNDLADLNLLRIFEAVMIELNVSRAAQRLNITQPAVSHALRRLRRVVNDELFLKTPNGVSPTPKALELWEPVRESLAQINKAFSPPNFNPALSTQTFTLAGADYVSTLLLPEVLSVLSDNAPNIDLRLVPNTNINAPGLLEQSEIDISIGRFYQPTARLRVQELMRDRYVCVMRKNHPLAKKRLTLKQYVRASHVLVTLTGEATGFVDKQLEEMGLQRRIALTVNQFVLVPKLVAGSNLISVLPLRIVRQSPFRQDLHIAKVPLTLSSASIQMMWHERRRADPAHEWLRSCLIEIARSLPSVMDGECA